MFKKKPIYIVGIVLFTLILVANCLVYFFVPTGFGKGDFGGGMKPNGFGGASSDFGVLGGDESSDGENSGFGSFGGGAKDGRFDKGNFDGELPDGSEGFTKPDQSEMPEGMELPEDFDPSDKPDRSQMGGQMPVIGALSTIRNAFWPILIVCVLGDGLCIFVLVRICKKKKSMALQPEPIAFSHDADNDTQKSEDQSAAPEKEDDNGDSDRIQTV